MKKSFVIVILAVMVLSVSGCGSCRNLFGLRDRSCRTPLFGRVQPCTPSCCTPTCGMPSCCEPCCEGSGVSYGYGGEEVLMPQLGTTQMGRVEMMPTMEMVAPAEVSCNCGQ